MSKIVKAGRARILPPDEDMIIHPTRPEILAELEPDEELPVADEKELRAAYEDLMQTAQDEAALIMEDAKKEARQIAQEAQQEAEVFIGQEKQKGFEQGYTDGYAAGVEAARAECEGILQKAQQECDTTLQKAYEARDRLLLESEPKILGLALDIARKILGYELSNSDDAFKSIVETAIGSLTGESHVTLHVHTSEFLQAFQSKQKMRVAVPDGYVMADVQIDHAAQPGDCVIETGAGAMDVSVGAQLEKIGMNLGLEPEGEA